MADTLTAEEMRSAERACIDSGVATGATLMSRAGGGFVETLCEWPEFSGAGGLALVLCGPGNNGGDGYVIARGLLARGWRVTVAGMSGITALPRDAAAARRAWEQAGDTIPLLEGALPDARPDLLVDAIFGTGLTRDIEGPLAGKLVEAETLCLRHDTPRWAVDLPSGLATDTGRVLGAVLPAHVTVTFHRKKPAHVLREDLCGQVEIVDIGL